jgi:hypothetical protein
VIQADLRGTFKEASKSASTSPIVVAPTSTFPAIKTPENTEDDPDDPNSEDEGDIQMEYTSH